MAGDRDRRPRAPRRSGSDTLVGMGVGIAPSGFKERLRDEQAAGTMRAGICAADSTAGIDETPLVEGDEGFGRALVRATGGALHWRRVDCQIADSTMSWFGIFRRDGPCTAVPGTAAVVGLDLVPLDQGTRRRDRSAWVLPLLLGGWSRAAASATAAAEATPRSVDWAGTYLGIT